MKRRFLFAAALGVATALAVSAHAADYTITCLGDLGGSAGCAYGINRDGHVVGFNSPPDYTGHAYIWRNGRVEYINGYSAVPRGINNHDDVVGSNYDGSNVYGAIWRGGAATPQIIGTNYGSAGSYLTGINDYGVAVGYTFGPNRAFMWKDNQWTSLGALGGNDSVANAINNNGWVVGHARVATGEFHAFLYRNSQMEDLTPLDNLIEASARAINENGDVVGVYRTSDHIEHGFKWSNNTLTELFDDQGRRFSPWDINIHGDMVGSVSDAMSGDIPSLWLGGQVSSLSSHLPTDGICWGLKGAFGINDVRQVVGYGYYGSVGERGFVMTPVPEPSSLLSLLLGVGGTGLVCTRLRRRL